VKNDEWFLEPEQTGTGQLWQWSVLGQESGREKMQYYSTMFIIIIIIVMW
jgi:hypothetical protein